MSDEATNPEFLEGNQYRDSSNLSARIRLHKCYSTNTYPMYRWEFDLVLAALGRRGRVLEVGCGRGDLWKENIERVPEDWQVTLADVSEGMLEDARSCLGTYAERFDWETADVQALPFEDDSFDAVVAHFMLYHVPDLPQAIREIARVLRPDGTLHAATNGRSHMREMRSLAQKTELADETATPWHRAFNLENGAAQLEDVFDDVLLVRRDDGLRIPDTEPIVDYLLSSWGDESLDDSVIDDVSHAVQSRIDEAGEFAVTKDSGIFVAREPRGD